MSNCIVIFGASGGAKNVSDILTNVGYDVLYFVDNDRCKWGTEFEGKQVQNPAALLLDKSDIVIASTYYDEILKQLFEMGISQSRIHLKEDLIIHSLNQNLRVPKNVRSNTRDPKIFLDMSEGFQISGVEKWSMTVVRELERQNYNYEILSTDKNNFQGNIIKQLNVCLLDFQYCQFSQTVLLLVEKLVQELPAIIIANRISQVFMAAVLVKQKYPNKLRLISVIHSDYSRIYEQNRYFADKVDKFVCVSKEIKEKFIYSSITNNAKIQYLISPQHVDKEFRKNRRQRPEPIVIAYAARLEKAQKRADLLIPFIKLLEHEKLCYVLKIAGTGSFYVKLQEFLTENKHISNVILYGNIPFDKMEEFWKNSDIVVNFSEIEGTALSMIEGMAFACVPIVTRTSGVDALIRNMVNGYIVEQEDIALIVERIVDLEKHREKMYNMGKQCRKLIVEKCNVGKYVEKLIYETENEKHEKEQG